MVEVPDETGADKDEDGLKISWASLSVEDLSGVDLDAPVKTLAEASRHSISRAYREAASSASAAAARVYAIISDIVGMHFKPQEPNEPFGPMFVMDGRRSPIPTDFSSHVDVIQEIAGRIENSLIRAILSDLCWIDDRRLGRTARAAVAAYVDVIAEVKDGRRTYAHDVMGRSALSHESRDYLTRALSISRRVGWQTDDAERAKAMCLELCQKAVEVKDLVAALWFSDLAVQQRISNPMNVAKTLEALLDGITPNTYDDFTVISLWKLAARAYQNGSAEKDHDRCLIRASLVYASAAETATSKLIATAHLSDAITTIHGVRDQEELRQSYRQRLALAQENIDDEMSVFSQPLDLEESAKNTERRFEQLSLSEGLFALIALTHSPDPKELADKAKETIREYPMSSLFGSVHLDHEGKVIHRTTSLDESSGLEAGSPIRRQIGQAESLRRHIAVHGAIEPALNVIAFLHSIDERHLRVLTSLSGFVQDGHAGTYARGFARFLQRDYVSACYILFPLLENSLRHVLRCSGHAVSSFDDATQTQKDRSISLLFEKMRPELDAIFGKPLTTDIESVFLWRGGPHLRHSLCHGVLFDGEPYRADVIYGCWLILRLCLMPLFKHRDQFKF